MTEKDTIKTLALAWASHGRNKVPTKAKVGEVEKYLRVLAAKRILIDREEVDLSDILE